MEIKEGMYVRYKRIGDGTKIAKIKEILPPDDKFDTAYYKFNDFDGTIKENIIKASYNIIDLLDLGDFINYHRIEKYNGNLGIFEIYEDGHWYFNKLESYIKENEIKSVVTKEQFKNMEYEVQND